jgi:hypothetical protein
METIDKHYVTACGKQGKMFILNGERLESMTVQEYNERYDTTHSYWEDINDDNLYSADEVIGVFGDEEVKFV